MEFKDKIKFLRKEKGISQQALADAIFVSRSTVAKWENGLGLPSKESRSALEEYFGVDLDTLKEEPNEDIIVAKNKKIHKLVTILVATPLIAIITLLIIFINGYSFSERTFLGEYYNNDAFLVIHADEYSFGGVLWDVIDDSENLDHMYRNFRTVKKTGPFYKDVKDDSKKYYLYDNEGERVALLECFKGKTQYHYLLTYISTPNHYKLLSKNITANGKDTTLYLWSYFSLNEPLETISILGQDLVIEQVSEWE